MSTGHVTPRKRPFIIEHLVALIEIDTAGMSYDEARREVARRWAARRGRWTGFQIIHGPDDEGDAYDVTAGFWDHERSLRLLRERDWEKPDDKLFELARESPW